MFIILFEMTSVNLLDTTRRNYLSQLLFFLSQVLFITSIMYDGMTKVKN